MKTGVDLMIAVFYAEIIVLRQQTGALFENKLHIWLDLKKLFSFTLKKSMWYVAKIHL